MELLQSSDQSRCDIVKQLLRLKLQLQIVEARVREMTPQYADLISDIADEAEQIIEHMRK